MPRLNDGSTDGKLIELSTLNEVTSTVNGETYRPGMRAVLVQGVAGVEIGSMGTIVEVNFANRKLRLKIWIDNQLRPTLVDHGVDQKVLLLK